MLSLIDSHSTQHAHTLKNSKGHFTEKKTLIRFDRLNDDEEMAVSTGLVSTFISGETASLAMPYSTTSSYSSPCPRLIHCQPPANLRTVRIQTLATASKQATTGRGELRGIMKPRRVTPEMEAIVGSPEISRTQALKLIWAHIKQNNLQDPENKKIIVCDEKLKKIFKGRDRVGFLEVAGLITPHFL